MMTRIVNFLRRQLVERLFGNVIAKPLFSMLYPKRKATPTIPPNAHVLIWCIDSLGDAMFITPFLHNLKDQRPDVQLTLVCNRQCHELFEANPNLAQIFSIDPHPYYTAGGYFKTPCELKTQTWQVMIVLEMGSRPADCGRLIARRLRIPLLLSSHLGMLKSLPDVLAPINSDEKPHWWADHYLSLLDAVGIQTVQRSLELYVPSLCQTPWQTGRPFVVIHPFVAAYGAATKAWPGEKFRELIGILVEKQDVVIGGALENRATAERMRQGLDGVINLCGKTSMISYYQLMRQAKLIITCDTSALHLANAAGVPTVAIFGATDEKRIAQIANPLLTVIKKDMPCRPCHRYRDKPPFWPTCIYPTTLCLQDITVESVMAEARKVLEA